MPLTRITGDNVDGSNFNIGIASVTSLSIGSTQIVSSERQLQNITSLDATTTATIETAIASGPNTFADLTVSGVGTFTNGPVLIGSGTSTGTATQRLQVTGGAYVSGLVGIGTTNPNNIGANSNCSVLSLYSNGANNNARSVIELSNPVPQSNGALLGDIYFTSARTSITGFTTEWSLIRSSLTGSVSSFGYGTAISFHTKSNNGAASFRETARFDSEANFLIGATSPTGTSSQPLQVTGGAYVSGNLGVGATNPSSKFNVSSTNNSLTSGFLQDGATTGYSVIQIKNTSGNTFIGVNGSTAGIVATNALEYSTVVGTFNNTALHLITNDIVRATIDTSGNLGVGITNPTAKLQVNSAIKIDGTSNPYLTLTDNSSNTGYLQIATGLLDLYHNGNITFSPGTSERVRITSGGNVGIGLTNPSEKLQVVGRITATSAIRAGTSAAVASGSEFLSVLGQASIRLDSTSAAVAYFINADTTANTTQPYLFFSDTAGNRAGWGIRYSDARSVLYGQGGLSFQTGTSGFNEANERVRIDSSGNLGIGTISVLSGIKLDVRGPLHVGGTTEGIRLGNVGDNTAYDNVKLYYTGYNSGNPYVYLTPRTQPGSGNVNTYLYLQSNNVPGPGSNTMGLLVDGSVGIGTANPSAKVEIVTSGTHLVLNDNTSTGNGNKTVSINALKTGVGYHNLSINGYELIFKSGGAETEYVRLNSAGSLGIGTANPAKKLHLQTSFVTGAARGGGFTQTLFESNNSGTSYWEFQANASSTNDILFSKNSSGSYGIVGYDHSTDSLRFFANSAERLRIDSSGNLGIGLTNPGTKLEIVSSGWANNTVGSDSLRITATGATGAGIAFKNLGGKYWNIYNGGTGSWVGDGNLGFVYGDGVNAASGAKVTFSSAGNIILNSGQGIDFSATGNSFGTMTSELLDDYETGTWTPVWQSSGSLPTVNYATQSGYYVKIGRVVHFWGRIYMNSWGAGGSGNIRVGGLPFTSNSDSNHGGPLCQVTFSYSGGNAVWPTGVTQVFARVLNNTTTLEYIGLGAPTTQLGENAPLQWTSNPQMYNNYFSGSYFV